MKLPPRSDLFFISQSAYMCPGTLRDQLTYPKQLSNSAEDEKLLSLLAMVFSPDRLKAFLDRFTLDSVFPWTYALIRLRRLQFNVQLSSY